MNLIFSDRDTKSVRELLVPEMGTESLAPLLHFLLRFIRAKNVLEGGSGYTTPFLAAALEQNRIDFLSERESLLRKTEKYVSVIKSLGKSTLGSSKRRASHTDTSFGLTALYRPKASLLAQRRFDWLSKDPCWTRPHYYMQDYEPKLFCIDDLSDEKGSAPRVRDVIEKLGLAHLVEFHNADFWTCHPQRMFAGHLPLDLIWVDLHIGVKGLMALLKGEYWECLSDHGYIIIHDMMTTRGGRLLVNQIRRQQTLRFPELEVAGFLEPHRLMQGDFVLIRKTSGPQTEAVDNIIKSPCREVLEEEAQMLVRQLKTESGAS
jgi:hypothetical protein